MGVYVCVFNFVSQSFSNAKRTENNRMNPQRHIIQLQQLLKFHHSYFILSSTYFSAIFSSIFHFTHFTHTYVSVQRVFCRLFFFIKNLFYFVFNWRIITILCWFRPYISMNQPQEYVCLTLAIPGTVALQASLSVGFSRQEYWSRLPFPSAVHRSGFCLF